MSQSLYVNRLLKTELGKKGIFCVRVDGRACVCLCLSVLCVCMSVVYVCVYVCACMSVVYVCVCV